MNKEQLRQKAASLPLKPGVYIMQDKAGKVIYVGKAKALRNRVSQYFHGSHTPKTAAMVERVSDFDTIVAGSEFDALVLECSLIKRHQPKYNILLKDGKGFPFIRVPDGPYPRLGISGRRESDGARYFGPYGGRNVAFGVIRALSDTLKLPTCERQFPRDAGKGRPCLQHHMGRCVAPCTGNVAPEEYGERIEQAVLLMEGRHAKLLSDIEAEMTAAADGLMFEKAAALRDRHRAVSQLSKRQKVVAGAMSDMDVIGCHAGAARTFVAVLHYLAGELYSRDVIPLPPDYEPGELVSDFLKQYYGQRVQLPKVILIPCDVEDRDAVAQLLRQNAGHAVKLYAPKRGDEAARVALANANAKEEAERLTTKEEKTRKLMRELTRVLGLTETVRRIEAYDISNTGPTYRVGAMTVHEDGEPRKRGYRLFAIKDASIQDDFHAMQEVLTRRFQRLAGGDEKFSEMPDVLLIDGGAVHANMARQAIQALGVAVPVFGMVKDHRHRTRALVTPDGGEIGLEHDPVLFALIGRIQEETHRFAITYHQKKRDKGNLESVLDGIPGVGPKRIEALRGHFKTLKAIKQASEDELAQVVPAAAARAVYGAFHAAEGEKE